VKETPERVNDSEKNIIRNRPLSTFIRSRNSDFEDFCCCAMKVRPRRQKFLTPRCAQRQSLGLAACCGEISLGAQSSSERSEIAQSQTGVTRNKWHVDANHYPHLLKYSAVHLSLTAINLLSNLQHRSHCRSNQTNY
jgi:hypothetical protein